MGYEKIPDGYNFNSEFDYVLVYSPSDCAWSITNKRFYYYVYPKKEFKTEDEGVEFFENNLEEFYRLELGIFRHRPSFAKDKIYLLRTKPVGRKILTSTEYDMRLTLHGYWEDCSNGWICSVCNRDNKYDEDICPHCGAIMDLTRKEKEEVK